MKLIRNQDSKIDFPWLLVTITGAVVKGFYHREEARAYNEFWEKYERGGGGSNGN